MPFVAKSAAPRDPNLAAWNPVYDQAACGGITLLTAPPGYLLGEDLAASVARRGRGVIWLRLGPEDHDPGTLLASLVDAARRHDPALGPATAELMRREPGPVGGWPALFDQLAAEFNGIDMAATLVVEHVHHLDQAHAALGLLATRLFPTLPPAMPRILTSHRELPPAALPPGAARWSASDLRIDPAVVLERIAHEVPGLSDEGLRHAAALCQGRAAALAALHAAAALLGVRFVDSVLRRAASLHDLLGMLAGAWLGMLDPAVQRALGLGLRLGYVHSSLLDAALGGARLPQGPWLQALASGWWRVRTEWRAPLRAALGSCNLPDRTALRRAAEHLASDGAIEQAVPFFHDPAAPDGAVQAITGVAGQLLDLGQWELLAEWLDRIPDRLLEREPSMVYCQAEIHAALGRTELAERRFALAASLFGSRHDADGVCRTALAESALATLRHDTARAGADPHRPLRLVADPGGPQDPSPAPGTRARHHRHPLVVPPTPPPRHRRGRGAPSRRAARACERPRRARAAPAAGGRHTPGRADALGAPAWPTAGDARRHTRRRMAERPRPLAVRLLVHPSRAVAVL